MLNSKLLFELSKLPDLPVVILTNAERDAEIRVIAIDRHRGARIILADCLLIVAMEYGQTIKQLLEDEFIQIVAGAAEEFLKNIV